jgi:hypothetical protein
MRPSKQVASNAREAGSGTEDTFSVIGVIVPESDPALTKVKPVMKA